MAMLVITRWKKICIYIYILYIYVNLYTTSVKLDDRAYTNINDINICLFTEFCKRTLWGPQLTSSFVWGGSTLMPYFVSPQ